MIGKMHDKIKENAQRISPTKFYIPENNLTPPKEE